VAAVLVIAGCGGGDQQQSAPRNTQADSVALAAEQFDASVFDTLTWNSDTAAINRGRTTYSFSCRKCHGPGGLGDGGFVFQGDTLHPPSLVAPDFKFAGDPAALRLQVFTGNSEGMPHWGLVGLKMRDVDAVTRYILEVIRAGVDTTTGM
jgi:mono/diheme cytochrome c family protein